MSIIVNSGETALITQFEKAGIAVTTAPLLCGDIHIVDAEDPNRVRYIFERKAKGDLNASIIDNRYKEQKSRLFATGLPRDCIIYIIEALPQNSPDRVWSAICNMQHRDKIRVTNTQTIAETVKIIAGIAQSVVKFPDPANTESQAPVQVNLRKRVVQPADFLQHILAVIPGMSENIAAVILKEYPTLQTLQDEYSENGAKNIAELRHGASNRRIGKLAETVGEYLATLAT